MNKIWNYFILILWFRTGHDSSSREVFIEEEGEEEEEILNIFVSVVADSLNVKNVVSTCHDSCRNSYIKLSTSYFKSL